MKSLLDISVILKSRDDFYILTHKNPDGDTIGSTYALCRALQKLGKRAKVLCSDEIPDRYKFVEQYVKKEDFEPRFIVSVDVASTNQFEGALLRYADSVDLCIDHHMTNKNYADITFVDAMSASASEIIYSLIKILGVDIDKQIATCLYVGVSTDTGCFKYSNVTAKTHKIAADLIEKGIDLGKLNKLLFDTKPKRFVNLEMLIYKSMKYFFQDRCAITLVTLEMMQKAGVSEDELEGIASIPRSIEGVEVGVTIKEKKVGVYRVSVRTQENVNAVGICERFGGGGHACAAGFTYEGNIENLHSDILAVIKEKIKV